MRRQTTVRLLMQIITLTLLVKNPVSSMDFAIDWSESHKGVQACGPQQSATLLLCVGSGEAGQSVTMRTLFHLPNSLIGDEYGVQRIWLAGASSSPGAFPDIWGISWSLDASSWKLVGGKWTVAWRLELHTPQGTNTAKQVVELARPAPDVGHTYEVLASYDAFNGYVSLRLQDLTRRKIVYAGGAQVQPHSRSFWYTAGYEGAVNPALQGVEIIEGIAVVPAYLPVGVTWKIGSIGSNAGVGEKHFAADTPIAISLSALGADGGDFGLRVPGNGASVIYRFPQGAGQSSLVLEPGTLPLGQSKIMLDYAPQGQTLGVASYDISVGKADVRISPLMKTPGNLSGIMQVDVDQYTPTLDVRLSAKIYRLNWDDGARRYMEEPVLTSPVSAQLTKLTPDQTSSMPFEIEAPADAGYYRIEFKPESSMGLAIDAQGAQQWFHTFPVATTQAGSPFTIVVLPDTQEYARYFPDVLTRQTEWLASHAQDLGLGLVLHLGDVTDRNTDVEWSNVSRSFSLLDGVTPYVLAIGNHDLCENGQYVLRRNASKAQLHFSPDRFPALSGMFEPNRLDNTYHLLEMGGVKYLVLSLEYGPRDGVLDWANKVVTLYPDRKVIVVTHNYLTPRGDRQLNGPQATELASYPGAVNDAQGIWDKFASRHANILTILSGHMVSPTVSRKTAVGIHGNVVFELESDYSEIGKGGDGWMVLYQFTPDQKVKVWVYSPYLDQVKNDRDAYGFNCSFEIDLAQGVFQTAH